MTETTQSHQSFTTELECPIENPAIEELFDILKTRIFYKLSIEDEELRRIRKLHAQMSLINNRLE